MYNTFNEIENAFLCMASSVIPKYSSGKALVNIQGAGAGYDNRCIGLEGYARMLWGLAPYHYNNDDDFMLDIITEGLKNGTNPQSLEYWGDSAWHHQRYVEMAAISFALLLFGNKFFDKLSNTEKNNIGNWLNQINTFEMPHNNWCFFVILTNLALKRYSLPYSQKNIDEAFKRIDKCYLGNGWYSDGPCEQRDYYIPFAMHFYGLIYSKLAVDFDKERCEQLKERARLFANDYIYWFHDDGSSIPYGRSLTYRFAVSSFWAACAFADIDGLDWGIVKGIYLRNFRCWMGKDIFNADETLSVGVYYPNLVFAEGYNSPTSPYWAFKFFISLAIDIHHPFWTCKEKPMPELENKKLLDSPHMLITRNKFHAVSYPAGQYISWNMAHWHEKYSKFAYSTALGFSVEKASYGYMGGAYDSMLALSDDGIHFRVREKCKNFRLTNDYVFSEWEPYTNVNIKTWIIPIDDFHIRVHKITSHTDLLTCEGGFSLPALNHKTTSAKTDNGISVENDGIYSSIFDASENHAAEMCYPEANTNVFYRRTSLPYLTGKLKKGSSLLISSVYAGREQFIPPQISLDNGILNITFNNNKKTITL